MLQRQTRCARTWRGKDCSLSEVRGDATKLKSSSDAVTLDEGFGAIPAEAFCQVISVPFYIIDSPLGLVEAVASLPLDIGSA